MVGSLERRDNQGHTSIYKPRVNTKTEITIYAECRVLTKRVHLVSLESCYNTRQINPDKMKKKRRLVDEI